MLKNGLLYNVLFCEESLLFLLIILNEMCVYVEDSEFSLMNLILLKKIVYVKVIIVVVEVNLYMMLLIWRFIVYWIWNFEVDGM